MPYRMAVKDWGNDLVLKKISKTMIIQVGDLKVLRYIYD